ncbi:MAG: hypothetical protein ACTS6H_00165 [Candidatus Hodgkinia cicadicola]
MLITISAFDFEVLKRLSSFATTNDCSYFRNEMKGSAVPTSNNEED